MEDLQKKNYKKQKWKIIIGYVFLLAIQIGLLLIYRKAEITFSFKEADLNIFVDIFETLEIDGDFLIGKPISFSDMMYSTLGLGNFPTIFNVDIITLVVLLCPCYDIFAYVSSKRVNRYKKLKATKIGIGVAMILFALFLLSAILTAQETVQELGGLSFSLNRLGHCYWIFLIVQLVFSHIISEQAENYLAIRFFNDKKEKEGE